MDVALEDSELERNNANLVQQVVDGLQTALAPGEKQEAEAAVLKEQVANSVTCQTESQEPLTNQLLQMQQAMALLQSQVQNQGHQGQTQQGYKPQGYQGQQFNPYYHQGGRGASRGYQGRGRGHGRGRNNHYRQRNVSVYCWTHGRCGHSSANCQTKLTGHQDAAIFTNKMGGSTQNCPP